MSRQQLPFRDDEDRMPAEIRIVYPLVFGPLIIAWLWISFGFGWVVAAAIALAWLRSRSSDDGETTARESTTSHPVGSAQIRTVALETSPGRWADWRQRTVATYGRAVPGFAHAEFASQWVWFGMTRWALLPVLLIAFFVIAWLARGESAAAAEGRLRSERQSAYLTAFATPGTTAAGSVRRDALRQLVAAGVPLDHIDLSDWDLDREDVLAGRDLHDANLVGAHAHGVDLSGTNFEDADLRRIDASSATLFEANLRHADLHGSTFRSADGRSIDARHAKLTRTSWVGANLSGAKLQFADLRTADLREADLRRADLSHCQLERCQLAGADLHGARCVDADFSDTDLEQAKWGENDLNGARWRAGTVGLSSARAGWLARRTRRITRSDGVVWVVVGS